MKVGNFQGKKILRESFSNRLPKWSLSLPKKGFEVPIANWLQKDLKSMLEHVCLAKNLDKIGIKNHSMVQDWKNSLFRGKRDTSWKLWTLISYYYWSESKGLL
jgi:asparagine synthase (glutamine-hydrolysing)